MRTVKYIRVSTAEQNVDRQRESGVKSYIDKCSGSIPFVQRKAARELLVEVTKQTQSLDERRKIEKNPEAIPLHKHITTIKVESISRLGRNTLDILETVNSFTELGVCIEAKKEGIQTIIDGKENPTAKMVLSILATLAEYERELILERQREGIIAAKKRGVYENGGRPKMTDAEFITKPSSVKVLKLLLGNSDRQPFSQRESARLAGVSLGTVQKVVRVAREMQMLNTQNDLATNRYEDTMNLEGHLKNEESTNSKVNKLMGKKGFGASTF